MRCDAIVMRRVLVSSPRDGEEAWGARPSRCGRAAGENGKCWQHSKIKALEVKSRARTSARRSRGNS